MAKAGQRASSHGFELNVGHAADPTTDPDTKQRKRDGKGIDIEVIISATRKRWQSSGHPADCENALTFRCASAHRRHQQQRRRQKGCDRSGAPRVEDCESGSGLQPTCGSIV